MTDKLNEILSALGYPVERIVYTGEAETYFVFSVILSQPTAYADDESNAVRHIFGVDLYTKHDYTALLRKTLDALTAGGFTVESVDGEDYETDTKYFHVPITLIVLEE